MSPTPTIKPNIDVILEKIEGVRCDTNEIKDTVHRTAEKFEGFQINYAAAHERVVNRTDEAHKRIDELERIVTEQGRQLMSLTKAIAPLVTSNKILVWFAAGCGGLLIVFLFSILTHQVIVTFP